MLDLGHLPSEFKNSQVQVFNRPCTVTNTQWQTWSKPRGVSMAMIFCIGGGGGGGGGFTRTAGNTGGGGGGGGGSAHARILVPAFFLPDTLYIQVGAGGTGQVSGGGPANSGIVSHVCVAPNNGSATNILVSSGALAATGGGTGTATAGGSLGAAGTIAAIGSMSLAGMGFFEFIAGQAGIVGAEEDIAGGAQTIPTTSALCGGGGSGAGVTATDRAGGTWTAIAGSLLSEMRPTGAAAGSNAGSGGVQIWKPFFAFGGGGGASSNTGVGGAGGTGIYGSGGGGGGAGTTGGRGGDGGSGLVIIAAW